jgi:hypothetical protein
MVIEAILDSRSDSGVGDETLARLYVESVKWASESLASSRQQMVRLALRVQHEGIFVGHGGECAAEVMPGARRN